MNQRIYFSILTTYQDRKQIRWFSFWKKFWLENLFSIFADLKVLTNRIAMVFTAGVKMYVHCSSNGVDETHLPSCTQRALIVCNEMAVN